MMRLPTAFARGRLGFASGRMTRVCALRSGSVAVRSAVEVPPAASQEAAMAART